MFYYLVLLSFKIITPLFSINNFFINGINHINKYNTNLITNNEKKRIEKNQRDIKNKKKFQKQQIQIREGETIFKKYNFSFKNTLYNYRIININKNVNLIKISFNINQDVLERDNSKEHNGECCKDVLSKYIDNIKLLEEYTEFGYYGPDKKAYFILKPKKYKETDTLVIFLHGAIHEGNIGNAKLAYKDRNFGGNFNRLKNILFNNNIFYSSITFNGFRQKGVNNLQDFLKFFKQKYPNIEKIVFVVGSSGGELLSNFLLDNIKTSFLERNHLRINGIIFEGSLLFHNKDIINYLFNNNIKTYFIHGEKDKNIPYKNILNIHRQLLDNGISSEFILVKGGFHGTPIRMIDYKDALEFIFKK